MPEHEVAGVTALMEAPPVEAAAEEQAPSPRGVRLVFPVLFGLVVVVAAVLRAWHLSGTTLIYDETFTGSAARLSFGDMISWLVHHDVHPPLDALLRSPIAAHTTSEWLLRLPSAIASLGAVALGGWWLRKRPVLALTFAALMALGAFQLNFAWQARPYAVMALVGLALAVLAHRWLVADSGSSRPGRIAFAAGLVLLVGCFESESALLLAGGLFFIPGLRRDRDAWTWRASLAGAVALWALAWGASMLAQRPNLLVTEVIPHTTVHGALSALNELVDFAPALIPLTTFLVIAGAVCMLMEDRVLARVWLCGFALPFAVLAVAGTRMHVLLPKTLAGVSWGPLLALAFVVYAAAKRWRPLGVVAVVGLAVIVVPSTVHAMQRPQTEPPTWGDQVQTLQKVARPGDTIVGPAWLERPVDWYFGQSPRPEATAPHEHQDPFAFVIRPGPATGRYWMTEGTDEFVPGPGMTTCAPPIMLPDGTRIRCLQRPAPPGPAPGVP